MNMATKKSFFEEHWLLIVIIAYIILPIDLIPDRFPILGTLDDAGLLLVHILEEYSKWRKNNEGKKTSSTDESDVKEGEIVE